MIMSLQSLRREVPVCFAQATTLFGVSLRTTAFAAARVSGHPIRFTTPRTATMSTNSFNERAASLVGSNTKYKVPNGVEVWLYQVNAAGYEIPMEDSEEYVLPTLKEMVKENNYTDVIVMSHGWNVEKDKKTNSIQFAENMTRALVANDPKRGSRKVLFIAVHWPSHPSTALYRAEKGSSDEKNYKKLVEETNELRDKDPVKYWRTIQSALTKTDPKAALTLGKIADEIEASDDNSELAKVRQDSSDINDLPTSLVDKISKFAEQLSPSAENGGAKNSPLDGDDVPDTEVLVRDNSVPFLSGAETSIASPPADVAHDAITVKNLRKTFDRTKFILGLTPAGRVLDGASMVSNSLERIFFGQFQRRAAVVGARGVHVLMTELMKAARERRNPTVQTKFHIIGHSLGCHVATAAALGERGKCLLPQRLNSLILLQGAVVVTEYKRGGSYYSLSNILQPVAGPVVATTSCNDLALENMEMWHGPTLGRRGFKDIACPPEALVLRRQSNSELSFTKNKFFNVQANEVINDCTKFLDFDVDGAHGDLFDPELARTIWNAADVQISANDLEHVRQH